MSKQTGDNTILPDLPGELKQTELEELVVKYLSHLTSGSTVIFRRNPDGTAQLLNIIDENGDQLS